MKKHTKLIASLLVVVILIACLAVGLTACINLSKFYSTKLNVLADTLAMSLMGDDAYSWNVFSINPSESYGYEKEGSPSWYGYNKMTQDDADGMYELLNLFYSELKSIPLKELGKADAITYRSLESTLLIYMENYGSQYALDFALIGGSYISAEGGYVSDFASMVENYAFRNKGDIDDLLAMALTVEDAFESYLDYANDRVVAGYPLYDYTIISMQEYLDDVIEKGDDYYLYDFLDRKIDAADFLNDEEKIGYKASFDNALTNQFMQGVQTLSNGLDEYKGNVTKTERTYLGAYGDVGQAYYEWCLKQKTGMKTVDAFTIYADLAEFYTSLLQRYNEITDEMEGYKTTDEAVYNEFQSYLDGEKLLLDLSTPQEILAYVKEAAKDIVPALKSEPEISFKFMDSTVAGRTSTMAYYLKSPLDQTNAPEYITLNPNYAGGGEPSLLTTIAHEGYPGHLYAHVKAKESGLNLLTSIMSSVAFAEGWAVYTEIALLQNIAANTDNKAIQAYCECAYIDELAGFIAPVLYDIRFNYYGATVQDYIDGGMEADRAQSLAEALMEDPAIYVSYGYGGYRMYAAHVKAQNALGTKYNEVEFNGLLLSEGMGPTLDRLDGMTTEYIKSKK